MKLQHDFAPEAQRVRFVENKVRPATNRSPFALDGGPGGLGGGFNLVGGGLACAAFGSKIGNLVPNECADEPEVMTTNRII